MLKAFLGLLVSVVVLLSSAYVTPAYAASATVLITHIQAGGSGAATQEFVSIYNNGDEVIDISGWCLTNKNNIVFACFSTNPGQSLELPARTYAVAGSIPLTAALPSVHFAATYAPLSQSSGSITGGGDTVSLLNQTGRLIDQHAWTTSLTGGTQLERHKQLLESALYDDTDTPSDWSVVSPAHIPDDGTVLRTSTIDVCINIEGEQVLPPAGMTVDVAGICRERIVIKVEVSEILPNAIGTDEGNEFIELFNPNDSAVDLAGYILWVGPDTMTAYDFPSGVIIAAHTYLSFSNAVIPFSLLNSSSRVRVTTEDGVVVGETPVYTDPKDGASWATIGGVWQYSTLPTPGTENVAVAPDDIVDAASPSVVACAINQYRNPQTGRCRLLSTAGSTVTPCKDGQYRSEETNRCRNIASDTKSLVPCDAGEERSAETGRCRKLVVATAAAPCKQGQERSPETNRCRTVTKMVNADYAVVNAKTDNGGAWYAWIAIGGIVLLALGYAIWEWHAEIGKFGLRVLRHVPLFARLHK